MAVTSVRERFNGRDGDFGALDELTTTRTFLVTTNNKYDTALNIRGETVGLLPRYLEPHPLNFYFTCRRLVITQMANTATVWEATATYSTAPASQDDQDRANHENPVNRPVRTTTEGVTREKYVNKDKDGKPFANSAGDYYPSQVVDDDRCVIQVTKNVAYRTSTIFTFSNSLNAAAYSIDGWTIAAKCGKIGRFKYSEPQEENGFLYYVLTCEINVLNHADDWKISLLDEGFNYLDSGTKTKILLPNSDGDNEPPSEAVPLDGEGGILDEADPLYPPEGDGVFNEWDYYRTANWGDLPF